MTARTTVRRAASIAILAVVALTAHPCGAVAEPGTAGGSPACPPSDQAPRWQDPACARAKSAGCMSGGCHTATDAETMHRNPAVVLGCTDCHGGNPAPPPDLGAGAVDDACGTDTPCYAERTRLAHIQPRYPERWQARGSGNPERSYTLLNQESPAFVRFVNPGDLRVARDACGACHRPIVEAVERSLMANAAMFWGGASYNNGILPFKRPYLLGEAYTHDGRPAEIDRAAAPPSARDLARGILPGVLPLPAWETVRPADIFRVFERGGRNLVSQFPEIGLPNVLEEPGKPDVRASNRGPGTGARIAVPVLNLHKTRLNDPFLWFLGTNDNPGDFRSSGCTGCHVVYANDRDPLHAGPYAGAGHWGQTETVDPTIAALAGPHGKQEGHPLRHELTRAIPTSQCMICHMHQPNMFLNSFLGYTMWDYESDAPLMWPARQQNPSIAETHAALERNPEEAATRGTWADPEFLSRVWDDVNPRTRDTKFADYHGHGWNFRAIFKRDRHGALLDAANHPIPPDLSDEEKWKRAVHLRDIHAEKGMQCVDCHFAQDAHGDRNLYGEVAAAIEIRCQDCHGTVEAPATLMTSGPAAPPGGHDLRLLRNTDGSRRFTWRNGVLYQHLALPPYIELAVKQVADSVDPSLPPCTGAADETRCYNARAARAKTLAAGTSMAWGKDAAGRPRAHDDTKMACFTCHSSWVTSCAGCHLPIQANWKTERHKYEGGETRNFATYNPEVARDDMFQLGRHGDVKENIIAPVRSSSALVLSSTDINRNRIYIQQPPVAASGYSSQAFAPHFPHTVRTTETKTCTDCHLSKDNDNNAIMAQLLLLGTGFVNFVGFHAWVGTEASIEAVQVTEWSEPQAVIGSYLHRYAYPDAYAQHQAHDSELQVDHRHEAHQARCLQLRGEYLYVAKGKDGMQAYDVSEVANKNFSERIITAPFSPLGHDSHIDATDATCVALPTNQPVRPERNRTMFATPARVADLIAPPPDAPPGESLGIRNGEQPMHPIYSYAAVTDAVEGLILTNVETMADGEPRNNFLKRDLVWNPDGLLDGAVHAVFAGHILYVSAARGIVVVDLDRPLQPQVLAIIPLRHPRAAVVQFRYLFAVDEDGFKVVDVTQPDRPTIVERAAVPLADAQRLYVARTYAYVAAGADGLVIIDVERPEEPRRIQSFTADGRLNDARDVVVGATNASLFAYVADGRNGLAVVQLTSPETQPDFYGFSPAPRPRLIAWRRTAAPALALSRGLERDRAVDETGHQIAVFGRTGSRPFRLDEMQKLYLCGTGTPRARQPWTVSDDISTPRLEVCDWPRETMAH